jgi:6-pyruvoyl-tetrahydropterin synthase
VEVSGFLDDETGMVVDFYSLKDIINNTITAFCDHKMLNVVLDTLPRTTVEHMVIYFANELHKSFPTFDVTVQLREGLGGYARCTKERI